MHNNISFLRVGENRLEILIEKNLVIQNIFGSNILISDSETIRMMIENNIFEG